MTSLDKFVNDSTLTHSTMIPSGEWYNSLYFRWIVLPILAHVLSWITGLIGIILFPILVTIAQYLLFRIHPAINRAGPWFFTLPLTFFIWIKWGPVATNTHVHNILPGVIAYYAGQLLNTLFIPLIVKPDQRVILLNWLGSNIVAGIVWMILYKTLVLTMPELKGLRSSSSYPVLLFVYPIIGLIANGISSFFWSGKLTIDD